MKFTAQQIASIIGGTIEGNPTVSVDSISKIEEGTEGTISFLANPKYEPFIYTTKASIVLVSSSFVPEKPVFSTLIKVEDPYQSFATLMEFYQKQLEPEAIVEEPVKIHSTATIGQNCYVGAFSYIGKNTVIGNNVKIYPQVYIGDNVVIGDNTTLYPGVKVYMGSVIGQNCIFHSGVIIGSDGFGFAPSAATGYKKVPQLGNVIIEDYVEVGSNTTIDRATMGSTVIRKGVKLDNLIQIAHNVEIGENTVIAAQSGVSGSTKIGRDCMIGGQVGFVGHIKIADEVKVGAQSGVNYNVKNTGAIIQGSPAQPIIDFQKSTVIFKKLPAIDKKVAELEKLIKELQAKLQTI